MHDEVKTSGTENTGRKVPGAQGLMSGAKRVFRLVNENRGKVAIGLGLLAKARRGRSGKR